MSQLFDEMVEKHEKQFAVWRRLARENDWTCWMCGSYIEHDDELTYYLTDKCGRCEHVMGKDD